MNQALEYLSPRWLGGALLGVTLLLGLLLLWRRRRDGQWSIPTLLTGAAVVLTAVGGLVLPSAEVGVWVAVLALAALLVMLTVLVLTGFWSAPLGYIIGAAFCVGLGGLVTVEFGEGLLQAGHFLASLEPLQPWWLLLLLFIPLLFWFSFRSLAGLGPVRRWVAIGLRSALILLLTLALAETHARHQNETLTVLFLWDRSLSMPQDFEDGKDVVEARLRQFINDAVAQRGPGHERDKAGVIVFGRWPRLELPPSDVPHLRFNKVASNIDETHTDIAAAIKLALASFPEGSGKRIVLISDGNENLGNAEEQARIARQNGVQIDVVKVASGRERQHEVLVERIEAPPFTEKDARVPLRIILRSYHPQIVVGNLTLIKTSMDVLKAGGNEAAFEAKAIRQERVKLRQGLNTFYLPQPGSKTDDSYTYEAKFVPLWIENARGTKLQDGLPGDRLENNRASTNVVARGQRAVLLIEPAAGEHRLLVDRLQKAKSGLKVVAVTPGRLPRNPDQLAVVLSKFDSVILANLPAVGGNDEKGIPQESLTEEQQKVLRSNTQEQGCGLVMIGGPQSFGAGGWQGTEVEKALPVTCDLKSIKVEGKSGLVLIMHASEMAEGNMWQKKIAQIAVNKLSIQDMIGMLYYDWQGGGAHKWHIPFQVIGGNKAGILRLVDSMTPGDMPDAEPSLKKAYDALTDPKHGLGTKHIIFISDGDHWDAPLPLLARILAKKITCTTVCITTHGAAEVAKMGQVAKRTGGRAYHVTNPTQLPAIYLKESRLISQSFVFDKPFEPQLRYQAGPTEGLPKELPKLYGFVRTTKRDNALVEVPIWAPKIAGHDFPILAYWQYGLGKSVAFTSDARSLEGGNTRFWDHDWANSEMYGKFWEQAVDWSLRAVETGRFLTMTTEQRDGKVRVIIEARDDNKQPLTDLEDKLKAGITAPALGPADGRKPALKFEQKNSGVYEAEFKAEDVGSYFINISAHWKDKDGREFGDSVRAGVTIPYSPEFAEMESNPSLLERLSDRTSGKAWDDTERDLKQAATAGEVFRALPVRSQSLQPIWYWLVFLAGVGLLFDVAVRRITLEPGKVIGAAEAVWARLRGRAAAAAVTPQFLDRLQSRKAKVGESLERERSTRRFEAGDVPEGPPLPGPGQPPRPQSKPTPPRPEAKPAAAQEKGDYASRLLRAKKRVWEERDKDQGEGTGS